MPFWLGEASDAIKERLRTLEPFMREHAETRTRQYFDQHRDDESRLERGPAVESMFEFFIGRDAEVDIENVWVPERSTEVLAYLQIKYALMVMETYNKLLLSLRRQ
jgi:hypothetical protein